MNDAEKIYGMIQTRTMVRNGRLSPDGLYSVEELQRFMAEVAAGRVKLPDAMHKLTQAVSDGVVTKEQANLLMDQVLNPLRQIQQQAVYPAGITGAQQGMGQGGATPRDQLRAQLKGSI